MTESNYLSLGRSPHQIIRDGSFATKKQFIQNELFHHHVVQNNIALQALLKKLHATLIHEKVPDFYGYFFIGQLTLCLQDRIAENINRQIQLLKSKQSSFHLIMRNISVREKCLQSIASCIESLFEQAKPVTMGRLTEQISHMRELTVLVVEEIRKWKNSLLSISQNIFQNQHISFFYLNEDYLLKILRDTDFISKSFLSDKVIFSQKQDPFLMRPYTQDQSNNQFVTIFAFTQQQKNKYMTCLQFLADERADYVKRKIAAKQDRIKEIQRVYQTNQLNEKILITKVNPLALRKPKPSYHQAPIDFIDENPRQESKKILRSKSRSQMRESKNKELQIKGQKIRRIKEMELGSPLINVTKFNSLNPNAVPITRSVSLGLIKKKSSQMIKMDSQKDAETDFEALIRKKELEVMQNDNIKRRTLSTVRLKDRLSERKLIDNKEGAEQLRIILNQIEHSSPQKEQNFFIRRQNPSRVGKSLIQQNEEIMVNLRESILKEMSDQTYTKQKVQQQRREQNLLLDKVVKMKLDQETLRDIQITKKGWIEGKDVLASDINKKELFGFQDSPPKKTQKLVKLQQQLKREMQLKFLRQVHEQLSHRQALSKHEQRKKKQQEGREKQLQVVLRKKEQQVRFEQIEREQRSKVIQEQMGKEEAKKKEIQKEMEAVIQREQQKLIQFSNQQKMKLQSQLRESMKEKLLTTLRKQKSAIMSQKQAQQKQRKLQQSHRAQVRKRMEEEFQIEKNIQRQRQRQQKNRKLRLIAQKMDHIQSQISQSKPVREESMKESRMLQLRESISKIPITSSKAQQQTKKRLREQFQLQLFAFNRPQNLNLKQDNFIVKDYKNQIDNEQNLNRKIQLNNKPQQQVPLEVIHSFKEKQSSLKASNLKPSRVSQKFQRFSEAPSNNNKKEIQKSVSQQQLMSMGLNMTAEQYAIYKKKKEMLNVKRINPPKIQEVELKKVKVVLDDFQKMSNLDSQKQEEFQEESQINTPIIKIEKPQASKQEVKQQEEKKQQMEHQQIASKIRLQKDSQDLSDVMKLTVHSKIGSVHKKKFITSDEDDSEPSPRKGKRKQKNQKQSKQSDSPDSVQQSFDKPNLKIQNASFKKIQADRLDEYLIDHFKKLPKLLRKLNLLKKDELLKSFDDYKSLMIVQVSKEELQGIVFAVENENKQNIRSLNMIHLGAYKQSETINVLIKARDLLFASDPCSQITFSIYYNKEDEDQSSFIKQFQKQFDPYGAIFQKKISNTQIERKHVLRRMIGEQTLPSSLSKSIGQLKINQNMLSYSNQQSLGVDLQLQKTGTQLGSWTLLSLFLSNYCKEQQIVTQLTSDVSDEKKNIKHLSKMVMKLKNSKINDIQYETFQNPFQTNLRLIEMNKPLIKCDPKQQQNNIPIILTNTTITVNPTLPFVSASAGFEYKGAAKIGKYLRFKCGKGSKVLKLKSSLYSSVITVLPCKPANYKILLTDAMQFDSISSKMSIDLYIKLFLANITQHSQSTDQSIWIPQSSSQHTLQVQYCQDFGFNNELRNKMDLSYTEYVHNCIDFKPTHRDLFITPPYILAVLNSNIQKIVEGSPIYIQRVDIQDLLGVQELPIAPPQSDF